MCCIDYILFIVDAVENQALWHPLCNLLLVVQ